MRVRRISTGRELGRCVNGLARLLTEAVDEGAAVGFITPLPTTAAKAYWRSLVGRLNRDVRLVVAFDANDNVLGTGQLLYAWQSNGAHRAELAKLIVAAQSRGRGIGSLIVAELEAIARAEGRRLLILNTRKGGAPVAIYQRAGFVVVGEIPRYTRDSHGNEHDTVIMYRWLD